MKVLPVILIVSLISFSFPPGTSASEGITEYAGMDTCKECHEDKYKSIALTIHGIKADPRSPAAQQGCESCHGPGAAHVSEGGGKGVGGILPLGPHSSTGAGRTNAVCLECHERFPLSSKLSRAYWHGSVHEMRGLTCTNCHSVHSGYPKNLAKSTQEEVCAQCHKQINAQLLKSSHHPIREGKIGCSDCHNPHGTVSEKLVSANSLNEKCYECHAEKRGPFLWDHPPVEENCMTCHSPHGSSHDKLLVTKRPYLCQTCHANNRHPGTLYAQTPTQAGQSVYNTLNNRLFYRGCSNCHSQIHGSNHPSGKSLTR